MEETIKTGEWIVHKKYGVGQVTGVEKKIIGGEACEYFRVKISTGFYWLPVQTINMIPEHVRFVSSRYKLTEALSAMHEKPNILSKNYKIRNREVVERADEATLQAKGELIRDLNARKHIDGVNVSMMDERQLAILRQQFLREMSIILDIEVDEAEKRVEEALDTSIAELRKN